MENIQFDSGLRSYRINGGQVLRFNPGDPNLYSRFMESVDKLKAVEEELMQEAQGETADGEQIVMLLTRADRKMKEILNWVFDADNDFQKILGGINLLAVAENGERVVTNLFTALEPVLVEGAKNCAGQQAAKARARREGSR